MAEPVARFNIYTVNDLITYLSACINADQPISGMYIVNTDPVVQEEYSTEFGLVLSQVPVKYQPYELDIDLIISENVTIDQVIGILKKVKDPFTLIKRIRLKGASNTIYACVDENGFVMHD